MVDRTSNTTFLERSNPNYITGITSASNGDTFIVPTGKLSGCLLTTSADDDAIVTASVSGSTVTIAAYDDAGAAITVDFNILFKAIIDHFS